MIVVAIVIMAINTSFYSGHSHTALMGHFEPAKLPLWKAAMTAALEVALEKGFGGSALLGRPPHCTVAHRRGKRLSRLFLNMSLPTYPVYPRYGRRRFCLFCSACRQTSSLCMRLSRRSKIQFKTGNDPRGAGGHLSAAQHVLGLCKRV